jgi:hypothetical protein
MSGIPEGAGVTRLRRFLVGSALVVGTLLGAGDAVAQNLEEYDYENLGLRALGVDVVWANAKDAKGAVGFGVRADLGFLGPYVRVVPRFAFWKADIEDESVARFERNLEALCNPPGCSIDLGELRRDYYIVGFDLQWTLADRTLAPYLGAGADLYILNDSGPAIKGTFLDDVVVTAGLSGVAGLQFDTGKHLRLYADVRGTLVTSASNVAVYAGIAYRF